MNDVSYANSPYDVLSHVLLASPYAIIVIQKSGSVVEWNPQAEILFGWSRDQAIGKPIHELVIPERLREKHIGGIQNFLDTGDSRVLGKRVQVSGMRRSGKEFPAELSITMGTGGKYFAAFVRDLSGIKQTEKLLLENQQRLAHVTRLNTLSELATGIAHEMNQPLTAIANVAAYGLLSENIDETYEQLRKVEQYVALAGQLVSRFRSLASESINERDLDSVNDQINEVLGLLDNQIYHQTIELSSELEASIPQAPIDRIQIQQVLVNLIQNAIDALHDEDDKTIHISSTLCNENIKICVRNSGKKLEDKNVFDSFYTTKSNGMGLGLAISRTIVENHGGKIWLNKEADQTEFCLTLPVTIQSNGDK